MSVARPSARTGSPSAPASSSPPLPPVRPDHCERVELTKGGHRLQQEDNDAATLDRLDGAREQIGREGLEVLQHEHAEGLPEDAVGLRVVAPADFRGADEHLEGVLLVCVDETLLSGALELPHALLLVAWRKGESGQRQHRDDLIDLLRASSFL